MKYIIFCISFIIAYSSGANTVHNFSDPVLQKRYTVLIKDIRCPVCQGQSIGGSDAPLAGDLRGVVADMLRDNRTDSEIFKFMTDRYGDFVMFKPPVNYHTYILWIAPFAFIVISLMVFILRRRSSVFTEHTPRQNTPNITTAKKILKED